MVLGLQAKLAAQMPLFARRRRNPSGLARRLRAFPLMNQAQTAMLCYSNAMHSVREGAAGQKVQSGGQGLPGAVMTVGARACR